MKRVTIVFPVTLEVQSTDTVESLLDQAAEIVRSTNIEPVITSDDGFEILDDGDLEDYVRGDL